MGYHKMETSGKASKLFFSLLISACVFSSNAATADTNGSRPWDAEIYYQVNREAWVKTTSARVDVAINMTLGREGLAKARKTMLDTLQILGKVDWQLTNFNRYRDQSGLEQISATATARFAENGLDGLRERAHDVSKPGSNYSVSQIDFTPSLSEVESARSALRLEVMDAVKHQLAEVKKLYPDQNYQITSLNFQVNEVSPMMQAPRMMKMAGASMDVQEGGSAAPLSISQKVIVSANVVLAVLNPKQ